MINLFEYISDIKYKSLVINEYANIIGKNYIISESFKSSIVQNLAKAIYDIEQENNVGRIKDAKRMDDQYGTKYGKHDPKLVNFASIFGPKTQTSRYGNIKTKGLQGVKWSEITDDDFKIYDPTDKELFKLIKKTFNKDDGNADFIVVNKNKKPIMFIKAYGTDKNDNGMYYLKPVTYGNYGDTQYKIKSQVKELTKPHYSSTRSYNANDVIAELKNIADKIKDAKVYALEITQDMIKDYKDLISDREESQKGVINYDKKSLEQILNQQQARYKTMIKEIRADRLKSNPTELFDEIKHTNDKVVKLYKKVMAKPDYIDKYFDLGSLMDYVARAYDYFYKSMKNIREGDKAEQEAIKRGETEETANRYRKYSDINANDEINRVKEYLSDINKGIEKIENELK